MYDMERGKMQLFVVVLLILTTIPTTNSISEGSKDTQHCAIIPTADGLSEEYHCVKCLFPQNCLANNTCRTGSYGATCEKCLRGGSSEPAYYRVGNTCVKCPTVPWPVISFGGFVLLACIAIAVNGFTDSVCTKLKLLCHFVQYLLLCLHLKVPWPELIVLVISGLNFGGFNSTVIIPECLFKKLNPAFVHYLEWLSSLSVLTIVFLIGKFLDNIMAGLSRSEKRNWGSAAVERLLGRHKRTVLRRFVFFILVVMYVPVAVTGIHTYLCSNSVPAELVLDHSKDIFLLDNDMSCTTFTFETFGFVATLYIAGYVLAFPILIVFLTLRQRKWDLLYTQWTLYGPAYESYKDFFCFGEALHLLRKLVSIVITDAYPVRPLIQIVTQLSMSGVYLLIVIVLRPYRSKRDGCVMSTAVICVVQAIALRINFNKYDSVLDYVAIAGVGAVLLLWLILLLAVPGEKTDLVILEQVLQEDNDEEKVVKKTQKKQMRILNFWKKKQVGPDPEFLEKVEERKQHINF